jgi:ABC-type sulfate/molybdate transport systems ATPase subunit
MKCAMLDAHIQKRREQFTVDVAVRVGAGEACGLFGASGAGKSTILACIAGAELPDAGHVTLDDVTLFPPAMPLHRRPVGYLTQDANLFPHLRVAENVRFGLTNGARDGGEAWVAQLRERLQLEPIWNAPAHAISGGQSRRVALARMLARRPHLVLLDEPFSGLDRHLVRELLGALAQWQRELGFTMLLVDHESDVLERLCTRAIVVERGRIVQDATWSQLRAQPATPLLAQLLAPL